MNSTLLLSDVASNILVAFETPISLLVDEIRQFQAHTLVIVRCILKNKNMCNRLGGATRLPTISAIYGPYLPVRLHQ